MKHTDKMYFIISKPAKLREQVSYRVYVCMRSCVRVAFYRKKVRDDGWLRVWCGVKEKCGF